MRKKIIYCSIICAIFCLSCKKNVLKEDLNIKEVFTVKKVMFPDKNEQHEILMKIEKLHNDQEIYGRFYKIGWLFMRLFKFDKAFEYFSKSCNKQKDIITCQVAAYMAFQIGDDDEMIKYFNLVKKYVERKKAAGKPLEHDEKTVLSLVYNKINRAIKMIEKNEKIQPGWLPLKNKNCKIFNPYPSEDEVAVWSGDCVDGKAHGKGLLNWDGIIVNCTMKQGHVEGSATYQFKDLKNTSMLKYKKYKGNVRRSLWEGYGTLIYNNGDYYEGNFKDDKYHGEGKIVFSSGRSISGVFKKGLLMKTTEAKCANGKKTKVIQLRKTASRRWTLYFDCPK